MDTFHAVFNKIAFPFYCIFCFCLFIDQRRFVAQFWTKICFLRRGFWRESWVSVSASSPPCQCRAWTNILVRDSLTLHHGGRSCPRRKAANFCHPVLHVSNSAFRCTLYFWISAIQHSSKSVFLHNISAIFFLLFKSQFSNVIVFSANLSLSFLI